MSGTTDRELVHKVNNLIAVVYTQVAVAKAGGSREEAVTALDVIERAAQETEKVVRRAREGTHEDGAPGSS